MSTMLSTRVEEPLHDSQRQAADLAAFRRMLQISSGTFSLSFAICDDRRLRDSLVKRFCEETPGILVVTLPAGVESVLSLVESQIIAPPPAAVFILDIEASIPHGGTSQPTLRVLNSSREHWEALRCPVVFWIADYAMTLLHSHAPDFWRYRSHQFEFVPDPVPLDQLKSESFAGYDMVDALSYDEKAFRVTELERRIREAGDPPSAELLPHVLIWLYELAHLYRHASRYQEAESQLRRALEWVEKSFGPNHSETANALSNLAQLLQATNRLTEAEPLLRRALQIGEKSYGSEHPNAAICLNNLAGLLKATNRLGEAEPLMRRALGIDEVGYGLEHPNVAIRLNNLAQLLKATNRLVEAEPLMRRALVIDESSYGPEHPNVAIRLNNLAQLLQATNRLGEAEPFYRRTLASNEASYGPKHPNVAISLNNLASLLQDTSRLAEAEPLMRRALQIDETSYGLEHPKVAISLNNLAQLLQATNRLAEAEPLMRRALGICVRSLGLEHPNAQTVQANYIALLQELKLPKAEIQERVRVAVGG
jgi:tetratricopeptide (TPR) repeat protein